MSAPPPPSGPTTDPGTGGRDRGDAPHPGDGRRERLTRPRQGKLLGGVAAGIAAHLDLDPVLVRVGFVVLSFLPFPGFGVLLYLVLLIVMPTSDHPVRRRPREVERGTGFYVGIALVTIAGMLVLGIGGGPGSGGQLLPLLLIGIGIALWVDADRRSAPVATSGGPTGGYPSSAPTPVTAAATAVAPSDPHPSPSAWTPPPPARERSPLGRVTLGVALVLMGAAWSVDLLGLREVMAVELLAVPLAVLGLGLLVGSVAGRARWLSLLALPLAAITLMAALVTDFGIPLRGSVGDRTVTITTPAQLEGPISMGAGDLVVDLRQLEEAPDGPIEVSMGVGDLLVLLPEGGGASGQVSIAVGDLYLFGVRSDGVGVEQRVDRPAGPGQPTFELDLTLGAGDIEVRDEVPDTDQPADQPAGGSADTTTPESLR